MRVFVTGAGGFIGSHIVKALLAKGHTVAVLRRVGSNPKRLSQLDIEYIDVASDMGKFEFDEQRNLSCFSPDVVIHAGWMGVGNSQRNDPIQLKNIELTTNILHASSSAGAKHFVGFGSQAEYGRCVGSIDETQSLAPTTLYGAAKSSAGLVSSVEASLCNMDFTWIRVFSTYGPGDEPYWMIQDVAKQLVSGKSPDLTPGTQLWDYLFVDDAAEAVVSIVEGSTGLGVVNLGSGSTATIKSIVELMRDIANPNTEINFGAVNFREDQVMHLEANISKLSRATGWKPRTSLRDGITRTVEAISGAQA